MALLGLQLLAMLAFSVYQYTHFAETWDFAVYNQSWTAIAHGSLNPYSSLLGAPFWRNNAEFVLWPLSVLYWLYPHPVDLLVVQDLAVVLTEAVAFDWALKVIQRSTLSRQLSTGLAAGTVVVLALDPWAWNTIAFDFHSHTISTLLVVLLGRDLWEGRTRRCWWWALGAILVDGPGALYVVGVGAAAAVASRQVRRTGAGVMFVGALWFVVLTSIGGDGVGGRGLTEWYGYLAGRTTGHVSLADVAAGAIRHPGLMAHMVDLRWHIVFRFLGVVGILGLLSPWGLLPSAVVFLPTIFNADPGFLRFEQSFQSWPAIPFVLIGTLIVITRLTDAERSRQIEKWAFITVWAALFASITWTALPAVPRYWLAVSDPAAQKLDRLEAMIPEKAEIVAYNGVIGRFGSRPPVYTVSFHSDGASTVPVREPILVFVITVSQGVANPPKQTALEDVAALREMGASTLVEGDGIFGLELRPQRGVTYVRLP